MVRRRNRLWSALAARLAGPGDREETDVFLRMSLIVAVVLSGFVAVVARSAVYQAGDASFPGDELERRVNRAYVTRGTRGRILDRTGRSMLAGTVKAPAAVYNDAPYGVDRTELGFTLAEVLGLDPETVIYRLMEKEPGFVLKRDLSDQEVAVLERLDLPGVRIAHNERRLYPMGAVLGPLVGVEKNDKGILGIEAAFDDVLRARKLKWKVYRDASRKGLYRSGMDKPWLLDGRDVITTIDVNMQLVLESALAKQVKREKAVGGMAIILDPRTFEILAMANHPSMDPNEFDETCGKYMGDESEDDIGTNPCRNKAVSFLFEPGSIAKIFTLSAALESGKVQPWTYVDGHDGRCRIGRYWVHDLHRLGLTTVADAVKFSSNCAMAEVGARTGLDEFVETLRNLGIGAPPGTGLQEEAFKAISIPRGWSDVWLKTASYGYGYRTSLLHLAVGAAVIANGGMFSHPVLVRDVLDGGDVPSSRTPGAHEEVRVLSRRTTNRVKRILQSVVMDDDGTGREARPKGFTAAGKTGTSRMDWLKRHIHRDAYLTSFVGFAPVEKPRIVVAVALIAPARHKYGGTAAGPVFREVVERVLPELGLQPDPGEGE